jgi:hypothetical protein
MRLLLHVLDVFKKNLDWFQVITVMKDHEELFVGTHPGSSYDSAMVESWISVSEGSMEMKAMPTFFEIKSNESLKGVKEELNSWSDSKLSLSHPINVCYGRSLPS